MEVQSTEINLKALWEEKIKMKYLGIYTIIYCQYIFLHNKEKLFSILWNLQTNLFRIDLPNIGQTYRGQVINPRPRRQPVSRKAGCHFHFIRDSYGTCIRPLI